MKEHLTSCDFTLLPCPNECKEGSEVCQLLRKDMEQHKLEECARRQYKCPYCKEDGEYQERTTSHLEICPIMKVPCPNAQCNASTSRCNISSHRKTCIHEMVHCKYSSIGCKKKILRKNLKEHEDDSQQHLQLAINTVHQLKTMVTKQSTIIAQIQSSQNKPITFRVSDFEHLKSFSEIYYSPFFFTNPDGYKMRIRVDANGNGDGKGTHVSVYAYLLKSENDDHLPWPFTGMVTFELLNQLGDKNHHSWNTIFVRENKAGQQVVGREMASTALGRSCYILHADLGYNEAMNCQYLKDDCLYSRITVNAEKSIRPWLTVNV